VKNPEIISQGARDFGSQCIVLGMDVKKVEASEAIPSGYEIVINGGRTPMGIDALWWAREGERLGTGEICLNSIDADGTQQGYELTLTRMISQAVSIPVIASGGAGEPEHLCQVLTEGRADADLIASMVHYGTYTIPQPECLGAGIGAPRLVAPPLPPGRLRAVGDLSAGKQDYPEELPENWAGSGCGEDGRRTIFPHDLDLVQRYIGR
jgi:hypothetical protein